MIYSEGEGLDGKKDKRTKTGKSEEFNQHQLRIPTQRHDFFNC